MFVTTSTFSKSALDFIKHSHRNIVLIDGQRLAKLMLKSGLGVTVKERFEVFDLDEDYFLDEE